MRQTLRYLFAVLLAPVLLLQAQGQPAGLHAIRPEYRELAARLSTAPYREPTSGNSVELIASGDEALGRMTMDILDARESVHMEFFIFETDAEGNQIRSALRLKGLDGLEVRFIAEDIRQKARFVNRMRYSGVQVRHYPLLPLRHRNHQKIVVLDGRVAYTGGMNIAHDNLSDWDDVGIRLRGPAVGCLDRVFERMWRHLGGKEPAHSLPEPEPQDSGITVQVVDDSPGDRGRRNLDAYVWALDHAKNYFYIKVPYFTPPRELRQALKDAVARGVDVRLLIPEVADWPPELIKPFDRSFYKEMVEAGVRIYLRAGKFDHSKIVASDDYFSAAGTVNLDGLSMLYNYENNLIFYDEAMTLRIKDWILGDLGNCYELTPEHIAAFPLWERCSAGLLRLIGPLL